MGLCLRLVASRMMNALKGLDKIADLSSLLTQVCQVKGKSCIVSICYQFRAFDFGTTSFQDMVFIVRTGLGSIPRAWYTSR